MSKQLNVKLLAWTMALGAFTSVGVFFLHEYQVRRNAGVLLQRAEEARAEGRLDKALTFLSDYVALAPEDTDALATMTVMIDDSAKTPRGRMRSFLLGEQVLRRDPHRTELRRRLVDIAMDLRRFGDAVVHLQVLRGGAADDAELAHLLGVCLEAGNQADGAVEAFQDAVRLAPARIDSATRLANLLRRKLNQAERADRILDDLVAKNPKDSKAWIARGYYRREFGGRGESSTDIQRALELAPDDADVLYAAADFANRQGSHDQAKGFLRKAIARYPQDGRMYQMLASLELTQGKRSDAIAQLRQGLEAIPKNIELLFSLGQVLIDTGENGEARDVVRRLRESGCPASFLDFLDAHLLVGEKQWDKAIALLEKVVPHLLQVPRLATKADFLLGRCYRQVGDGEKRLGAFRRAVAADPFWIDARLEVAATLADLGKSDEASEEYRQLLKLILQVYPEKGADSFAEQPELKRIAAEVALRAGDQSKAVTWARSAVDATASNYRDHLWLGQLLAAAGQPGDAEPALRRAVALGGDKPECYGPLIQLLVRANRHAEAEQLLTQARTKLPTKSADRFLAQGYDALGQSKKALHHYQSALAAQPDDMVVVRSLTTLLLAAKQFDEAEVHLRRLLDDKSKAPPSDRAWAARALAKALAARGEYRGFQEALALLDRFAPVASATAEDQRARALVLATQPFAAARQEAAQLLEALVQSPNVQPEDRLMLARLYESGNDWPKARALMNQYLVTVNPQPQTIAHHLRQLLRHSEIEEARVWQQKLAALAPALDPGGFLTIESDARLKAAEGHAADAVDLLVRFANDGKPNDREVRSGLAASLLEELNQLEPAEKLYRSHVQQRPDHFPLLAEFLARQKRVGEALDVCERSGGKPTAEMLAGAGMQLLRLAPIDADQGKRVDGWLAEAMRLKPDSMSLVNQLAELREMHERFDEAEKLYRRVLSRQTGNIVALNNLAWILALRDQGQPANEALELIDRAIEAVGPRPELIDTRAVVHLALKRNDLAIHDLEELVRHQPSRSALFHLARAHHQARDLETAADALLKAKKSGLASANVHALERKTLRDLQDALNQRQ